MSCRALKLTYNYDKFGQFVLQQWRAKCYGARKLSDWVSLTAFS